VTKRDGVTLHLLDSSAYHQIGSADVATVLQHLIDESCEYRGLATRTRVMLEFCSATSADLSVLQSRMRSVQS